MPLRLHRAGQIAPGLDVIQAVNRHVNLQRFLVKDGAKIRRKGSGNVERLDAGRPVSRHLRLVLPQGRNKGVELTVAIARGKNVGIKEVQLPNADANKFLDHITAQTAATDHRHPLVVEQVLLRSGETSLVAGKIVGKRWHGCDLEHELMMK